MKSIDSATHCNYFTSELTIMKYNAIITHSYYSHYLHYTHYSHFSTLLLSLTHPSISFQILSNIIARTHIHIMLYIHSRVELVISMYIHTSLLLSVTKPILIIVCYFLTCLVLEYKIDNYE